MRVKTVEECRRENLLALIQEAGSAARLAAISGVAAPIISQLRRTTPHSTTGKTREMGAEIARRLESKMGRARGWMDQDHSALSATTDISGREGQLVGLFRLLSDAEQAQLLHELTERLRAARGVGSSSRPEQVPKH